MEGARPFRTGFVEGAASISNLQKFTAVNHRSRTWHGGSRRRVRRGPSARKIRNHGQTLSVSCRASIRRIRKHREPGRARRGIAKTVTVTKLPRGRDTLKTAASAPAFTSCTSPSLRRWRHAEAIRVFSFQNPGGFGSGECPCAPVDLDPAAFPSTRRQSQGANRTGVRSTHQLAAEHLSVDSLWRCCR